MPAEWRRPWHEIKADETDAVKQMGKLLVERIPRAHWHRALVNALHEAQRHEAAEERERLALVLGEASK